MSERKTRHPFKISIGKNEPMQAYDLMLQFGGFASKQDAADFAESIVKYLEECGNAWSARVQ